MQLPRLGEPVGVLASQAMGEPVMQMTMNTFHSGGTSSAASLGVERVQQILGLKVDKDNTATLANTSGKITKIDHGVNGTFDTVYVNNVPHKVPHYSNGEPKQLRIKVGDQVTKGDFLTIGNIKDMWEYESDDNTIVTNAKPKQLFDLMSSRTDTDNPTDAALQYTQNYLTGNMEYVFNKTVPGAIDRRHIETVIGKLTSKVKVIEPGDSKYVKGQVVDRNEIDRWNAENASVFSAKKVSTASAAGVVGKVLSES
jgi:DNA-directed RNA polymerase subunit beta'